MIPAAINSFSWSEPVISFMVLFGAIFLFPQILKFIKIPEIASFIIAGVILGPYGLKVLNSDASIELLGTIGLLYIMFLAGIDLDTKNFSLNRKNSITFGILTFLIPFVIGYFVSDYFLELSTKGTLLVSLMFSTHTLISYPIVRKLGIYKDISITTAIGGTIITDTLVLILISFIPGHGNNTSILSKLFDLLFFFTFVFSTLYAYPKIAKWFFRYIKQETSVHFVFLLFMVSTAAVIARLINSEPIIGAFIAGLALNRSVPKNSLLMNRIEFIGNTLFIPFFLVQIGLMINLRLVITENKTWITALILTTTAIIGKWIAAYMTKRILDFNTIQMKILFALTSSHAAATIAIILIGLNNQFINQTIFNSTILVIFSSCILSSVLTSKSGKHLAKTSEKLTHDIIQFNTLLPVSNANNISKLVRIAGILHQDTEFNSLYILSIIKDDTNTKSNIIRLKQTLANVSAKNFVEGASILTRVDVNIANGITRTAKEHQISQIIIGWSSKSNASERLFGTTFDQISESSFAIYACNLKEDFYLCQTIKVSLPPHIESEPNFHNLLSNILKLSEKMKLPLKFECGSAELVQIVKGKTKGMKKGLVQFAYYNPSVIPTMKYDALNIFFIFKKQSLNYSYEHNNKIRKLVDLNPKINFILILPELGN
nr:cation:proton antiporter [uncultured Carboxylicivirga sp.]